MAYLYRHIRLDKNEVFYIGIGGDNNYKRANSTLNRNKYWKNIVNKSNYKIEIILNELTIQEAKLKEIEFISIYGRKDLNLGTLCNLTDGGEGLLNFSFSNESKMKMSVSQIGNKKYLLRKTPQSEINTKISNSNLGKKRTNEYKLKVKERFTKFGHPCLGRALSQHTKDKISGTKVKYKVVQFDLLGNQLKIWDSSRSVKLAGFTQSNVWRCCNNKQSKYKGFIWKYLKDIK